MRPATAHLSLAAFATLGIGVLFLLVGDDLDGVRMPAVWAVVGALGITAFWPRLTGRGRAEEAARWRRPGGHRPHVSSSRSRASS